MRSVRIVLFALGTVLGFGFAIHASHWRHARRAAFERHVAEVCIEAAQGLRHMPAPTR